MSSIARACFIPLVLSPLISRISSPTWKERGGDQKRRRGEGKTEVYGEVERERLLIKPPETLHFNQKLLVPERERERESKPRLKGNSWESARGA